MFLKEGDIAFEVGACFGEETPIISRSVGKTG